jgi:hypothetical protein
MPPTYREPTYPTVRFLIRFGLYVSAVCAVLPLIAVLVWFWPTPGWPMVGAGVTVGLLAGVFVQSYIEVLRIMSDTLLPR